LSLVSYSLPQTPFILNSSFLIPIQRLSATGMPPRQSLHKKWGPGQAPNSAFNEKPNYWLIQTSCSIRMVLKKPPLLLHKNIRRNACYGLKAGKWDNAACIAAGARLVKRPCTGCFALNPYNTQRIYRLPGTAAGLAPHLSIRNYASSNTVLFYIAAG
jgi:hypothetical protein